MDLVSFILLSFTSFFTIINPLGVMPVFMSLTSNLDDHDRKATAKKAVFVSFLTLLFFGLTGQMLFKFFSISIDSLRVVGGIIFFILGYDMLQARLRSAQLIDRKDIEEYVRDVAITPLAIPMITGPGAITNAIVLMESAPTTISKLMLFVMIFIVLLITFIFMINSSKILRMIGTTGNIVLMRLMGLIVMVIAVEFLVAGLTPILRTIFNI